ncbi:metallophosphoesterase [Acerihabitans arboris]|uniref:Phosphoprotein phosphatase n=1 Tax=Acerihabitans arboris TaxID=2691583 RepID=A0A845SR96_9GAMM|nr:metallophosphoesterase [Acerihabitans arboris]NDL65872.1 phosphoprotein phosphatase [Acerihabitans arboris]
MNRITKENNSMLLHLSLPINSIGRDFFVGDIHGELDNLKRALCKLKFDYDRDRLICTGDLIDRGPKSFSALSLLNEKFFFSVIGNHEEMLLRSFDSRANRELSWYPNGGGWWENLNNYEKITCRDLIVNNMALLITVQFEKFSAGVVHGDFPLGMNWSDAISSVRDSKTDTRYFLWQRDRIKNKIDVRVEGIDYIFLGHTPISGPCKLGNCYFIDTGSGHQSSNYIYNPSLTICSINDGDVVYYNFPIKIKF